MSDLTESVDSHQVTVDIGTTAAFLTFDSFLMFVCNQIMYPGFTHLHEFNQSREWVKCISSGFFNYNEMQDSQNSPGTHRERRLDALFPLRATCCKLCSLATACALPFRSGQGLIHTPSQMSDPLLSFWNLTSHCS